MPELAKIPIDKNDVFSTKKYQDWHGLKRIQATAKLNRLQNTDFIKHVEDSFPRWSPLRGVIAKQEIAPTSRFRRRFVFVCSAKTTKVRCLIKFC